MASDENATVRYVVANFYGNDRAEAARSTGFSKQQFDWWCNDEKRPQKRNIERLMYLASTPEFRIIAEYATLDGTNPKTLREQLRTLLAGHENASGIYAFYNSSMSLVYLGKSDGNLLYECYQQVRMDVQSHLFPKGVSHPKKRYDIVRYVSAYYVEKSDVKDYAKHVESLILRISKPFLNENVGKLAKA